MGNSHAIIIRGHLKTIITRITVNRIHAPTGAATSLLGLIPKNCGQKLFNAQMTDRSNRKDKQNTMIRRCLHATFVTLLIKHLTSKIIELHRIATPKSEGWLASSPMKTHRPSLGKRSKGQPKNCQKVLPNNYGPATKQHYQNKLFVQRFASQKLFLQCFQ